MRSRILDWFSRLCCVLFVLLFVFIFGGALLRGHLTLLPFVQAAILGCAFWAVNRFCLPWVDKISIRSWRILCAGGLILFWGLLFGAGQLLCNDYWTCPFDAEAVYRTAVELARGETLYYHDYFLTCDSNFFCMLLQAAFYRVLYLLGVAEFAYWGAALNSTLLWLSVVFLCLTGRRLWGRKGTGLLWLLSLLFVPLYAFAPFLYTDTMAAPFVMASVWQAVRISQEWQGWTRKKKGIQLALLGILLGLAFWMKGNSLVLWIAMALWLPLLLPEELREGEKIKKWLKIVLYTLVFAVAVLVGLKQIEHHIIDFSMYDAYHTPTLHWVMMGCEGDGTFNSDSFTYTCRFTTLDERSEAVRQRLASNYSFLLHNPTSLLWLLHTKAETCWLHPLFGSEIANSYSLIQSNWLSDWLSAGGNRIDQTTAYALAYYLMLWLGACGAAVQQFLKPSGKRRLPLLLAVIALIGNFCFFCLWEANSRYVFSMIELLLLLFAAFWLECRTDKAKKKVE